MFIAMNRFLINNDFSNQFVDVWKNRESYLNQVDGFMKLRLLKEQKDQENGRTFISYSEWRTEADFLKWMEGEFSQKAHKKSSLPKEAYLGRPEFKGYQVALEEGCGERTDFSSSFVDSMVEKNFCAESTEQLKIKELSKEKNLPPIRVGAFEGKLLYLLLKTLRPLKGLEIGTLGGYSASWLMKAMPKEAHFVSIEQDAKRAQIARDNIALLDYGPQNVEVRTGKALQVLENMSDEKDFDFIFLDADKENYNEYLKWAIPRLKSGGIILGDNAYIWGGMNHYKKEYNDGLFNEGELHSYSKDEFEGMSAFWKTLESHAELSSIILPTGEGLALAIKK